MSGRRPTRWVAMVLAGALLQVLFGCGSGTDTGTDQTGGSVNLSLIVDQQFIPDIARIDVQVTGPDMPAPATASVSVSDLTTGQTVPVRVPAAPGDANRTISVAAFNDEGRKILSGSTSGQFKPGQTLEVRLLPTFRVQVRKQGSGVGTVSSTPAGLDCGSTCEADFDAGSSVTLIASASPGNVFAGWSGAGCSGTMVCTVSGNAIVTAVFNTSVNTASLTVTKSGTGSGIVRSNPSGIECGNACSAGFAAGTRVTLTAIPSGSASFAGWSGACSGTGPCEVVLNNDQTVNAEFTAVPQTALLTVNKSGNGTVVSDPGGINCGNTCAANFASGSTVTLTATPAGGATFSGWGGACSGTGPCSVVMNGNQTVTAAFAPPSQVTLTVTTQGAGSGSVSSVPGGINNCTGTCTATFVVGTTVTLTANPSGGSSFAGWSGAGCSGTAACVVVLTSSQTVTATFDPPPSMSALNVIKAGSGTGTVSSTPPGINGCSDNCTAAFPNGTSVLLTANPSGGSTFVGWDGACSGAGSCTVVMNGNQTVTATFAASAGMSTLTINKTGDGSGTVTSSPPGINCGPVCETNFPSGTTVTLAAMADPGSTFDRWRGSGCNMTCVVEMDRNRTIEAEFDED